MEEQRAFNPMVGGSKPSTPTNFKDTTMKSCPVCEQGELLDKTDWHLIKYNRVSIWMPSFCSVCNYCKSELTDVEQASTNKQIMVDFRKAVDNIFLELEIRY